MLLKCCLLYIDMILPKYAIFCIFVSMSTSRSIIIWSIFDYHFHFHCNQSYNIIRTSWLVYLDIFVKRSASGCCLAFASFFANFSLALLIKVLLIKKRVTEKVSKEMILVILSLMLCSSSFYSFIKYFLRDFVFKWYTLPVKTSPEKSGENFTRFILIFLELSFYVQS